MGNDGRPGQVARREVGAAEEGRRSGVRKTLIGQPAGAGDGLDGLHVDGVDVGPLLAVDLDGDERGVEPAATAGSSKDSWAMTWHQWQAE